MAWDCLGPFLPRGCMVPECIRVVIGWFTRNISYYFLHYYSNPMCGVLLINVSCKTVSVHVLYKGLTLGDNNFLQGSLESANLQQTESRAGLLSPRSINACQQRINPSCETVPLKCSVSRSRLFALLPNKKCRKITSLDHDGFRKCTKKRDYDN